MDFTVCHFHLDRTILVWNVKEFNKKEHKYVFCTGQELFYNHLSMGSFLMSGSFHALCTLFYGIYCSHYFVTSLFTSFILKMVEG